jgi:hypothetical protein
LTGESARRHLRFHYVGDWRDIPDDWPDQLLTMGYDVLVSESYDWWSVSLSLPHDPTLAERLQPYVCLSDQGSLYVRVLGDQMLVSFSMAMDYSAAIGVLGEDLFEGLSDLFETIRGELLAGDLSAAWATYLIYGDDEEEGPEPVEPLSDSGRALSRIMERY